jgi:enterobacterial common antigen flippase
LRGALVDGVSMNGAAEPTASVSSAHTDRESTYGQILKSSALIGASSALTLAIGMVRTKVFAILLGPAGIGLLGLYGSIFDLTRSVAGMGINNSGVRQIAEAVASGDETRIARTVIVLRRVSIILGVSGALLLAAFCVQWSELTFGTDRYAGPVMALAFAVLFQLVADGRTALIQGTRRISDLAKMAVLGAGCGTLVSIPTVYVLGEEGVVLTLVAVAATTMASAWWYSRRIRITARQMRATEVMREARTLLGLGVAFMASGVLMMGAAYTVRIILVRQLGVEEAGLYQAAWTLGALYVGFILNSMGADFYPRLVAVANDDGECNRLVNEQTRVSLLLAGPGVIGTLTFAGPMVSLLYSGEFREAADVLRWICLGMALRVVTWPMGYIIVARAQRALFFGTELAWTIANVSLAWQCVHWFGVQGAGIAFFGSYVFHVLLIYPLVRRLSGFQWSASNVRTAAVLALMTATVFSAFRVLPTACAAMLGIVVTVASSWYTVRALFDLVRVGRAPRSLRRLLGRPERASHGGNA